MPTPNPADKGAKPGVQAITTSDYSSLANFLAGGDSVQRVLKRDPNAEAVKAAGQMLGNREFVPAYECFKPAYDKVVGDMQRVLARNIEFEANKLAQRQRVPIAAAKERVQNIRSHAQQVIDQFDRLMRDLESKPLVRAFIKKAANTSAEVAPPVEEPPPTVLASTSETWVDAPLAPPVAPAPPEAPVEIEVGGQRYLKAPYASPEQGSLYLVRDKAKGDRVIRVIAIEPSGAQLQVEMLKEGRVSKQPIQLAVDSLTRQAAKGWCSSLVPIAESSEASPVVGNSANLHLRYVAMKLDSQNFSRCCSDIIRANIKFSTQAIKDVQDGPFRAGNFEQAFLVFEQIAVGFNSAVANSRREISEGRRLLSTQKFKLSGKEVVERTAAFVRHEGLIQTAEREFSTILEGLRMYLRVLAAAENQTET